MDIHGQTVLITGGTRGIGRAVAERLASLGAHVLLVGRTASHGAAATDAIRAAGGAATFLAADLARMAETRRVAAHVRATQPRLDLLIHSADVLRVKRAETAEGIEVSFATNYLSRFLMNALLHDLLVASAPARIIHVAAAGFPGTLDPRQVPPPPRASSFAGHNIGQRANDVYAVELAERLAGTGVTVNVINPGLVDTEIRRNAPDGRWLMRLMETLFRAQTTTPAAFAEQVVRLALDPELRHVSGQLFSARGERLPIRPPVRDIVRRRALWARSEALVARDLAATGGEELDRSATPRLSGGAS